MRGWGRWNKGVYYSKEKERVCYRRQLTQVNRRKIETNVLYPEENKIYQRWNDKRMNEI